MGYAVTVFETIIACQFSFDPRDVPRRLPKTHACTKHDDAAKPTTHQATNSSDLERAQKSDLNSVPTAYCAMFNIAVLTPVGDALFPSSIVVRLERSSEYVQKVATLNITISITSTSPELASFLE